MITINFKKIIAAALSAVTMMSTVMFAPSNAFDKSTTIMSASAATTMSRPVLTTKNVYSNKIEVSISNLTTFPTSTKFRVYVNGHKVRTLKYSSLKSSNNIPLYHNSLNYFRAGGTYKVQIVAVNGSDTINSQPISVKTAANTYYKIPSNSQLYTLSNGKFTKYNKVSQIQYVHGILCGSDGTRIAGQKISKYTGDYVLINEGTYKGKYVKVENGVSRTTENNAKIQKVVNYAIGMNGGRYVWGGESYRATDCSGLTMLSYKQIGVNITHSAYQQARCGKASSMKNIKAGDIIICNNYGHAALYIGNGKIIHAMNSYYGIRIQPVANIKYCGTVNAVRSIVY